MGNLDLFEKRDVEASEDEGEDVEAKIEENYYRNKLFHMSKFSICLITTCTCSIDCKSKKIIILIT